MATRSYLLKHTRDYWFRLHRCRRLFSSKSFNPSPSSYSLNTSHCNKQPHETNLEVEDDAIPTSGISRPLSHILKELNKKVPDTLLKPRSEPAGSCVRYIPWVMEETPHKLFRPTVTRHPWLISLLCTSFMVGLFLLWVVLLLNLVSSRHIVNRIMNLHAPEWSGEVRSITYSADGQSVSVVYRVTLYGTDAEIFRESTGSASVGKSGSGDPVQKAEAMAFCCACARFGLGLHLYHEEDMDQ